MRLEARIYDAVGLHPRISGIVSWDLKTCCLTMEYLENGMLKDYITTNSESLTPQLRQRWAKQASEGLSVLQAAGVIHCDISPRNFLLDGDLHLKIADFEGGSLARSAASAVAGTPFRYPVSDWDAPPRFEEDVFGLGSLIYFIMTDAYPYKDTPSNEVEELYGSRTFPDVTEIACGDIITRCWGMQRQRPTVLPHHTPDYRITSHLQSPPPSPKIPQGCVADHPAQATAEGSCSELPITAPAPDLEIGDAPTYLKHNNSIDQATARERVLDRLIPRWASAGCSGFNLAMILHRHDSTIPTVQIRVNLEEIESSPDQFSHDKLTRRPTAVPKREHTTTDKKGPLPPAHPSTPSPTSARHGTD
ncbi:hypothetical protein V499_05371 [Pseudogymnoascus sp. VKM F-103]|nr:hypothetical protein V499_05371 [Pseudogymnoascus sp. VKM F-103]